MLGLFQIFRTTLYFAEGLKFLCMGWKCLPFGTLGSVINGHLTAQNDILRTHFINSMKEEMLKYGGKKFVLSWIALEEQ